MCTTQKIKGRTTSDNELSLIGMMEAALMALSYHEETLNDQNVFPVPDGDTGTNMLKTLTGVLQHADNSDDDSASTVAKAMWQGALRNSSGNSGVILSQLFNGLSQSLSGKDFLDVKKFGMALQIANVKAYDAVSNPTEGTILTVLKYAENAAREENSFTASLSKVSEAALEAVADSPNQLPILREAGVVDAGGLGLWIIFEAIRLYVETSSPIMNLPDQVLARPEVHTTWKRSVSHLQLPGAFGFCTQFLLAAPKNNISFVRTEIAKIAESVVVTGDSSLLKIHAHIDQPETLINFGNTIGNVSDIDIQNMDTQFHDYSSMWNEIVLKRSRIDSPVISVLAIVEGKGLEQLFLDLGAGFMAGGDSYNPTVEEIFSAVSSCPTDNVVILPNNKNIIAAAREVHQLTTKNIEVVETRSIPEGICALMELDDTKNLIENILEMKKAIGEVQSAKIWQSKRDATINGINVSKGHFFSMSDGTLISASESIIDCLTSLLENSTECTELVTLYQGDLIKGDAASEIISSIEIKFPQIEFELINGGQPMCHFVVSME